MRKLSLDPPIEHDRLHSLAAFPEGNVAVGLITHGRRPEPAAQSGELDVEPGARRMRGFAIEPVDQRAMPLELVPQALDGERLLERVERGVGS